MEYFWSENTIKDKIKQLKILQLEIKSEEERQLIENQIVYAQKFLKRVHTDFRQPKIFEAYNVLKNYVFREKFSWGPIYEYLDNTEQGFSFKSPTELSLSNDDILTITHDFYKSLSDEFFQAFLELYNGRYNHIRFLNTNNVYAGYIYSFPTLKEYFATIFKGNNVGDVFVTIHEIGHIIWHIFNSRSVNLVNPYIGELIPFSLEMIARDYLEKIFSDESIKYSAINHAIVSMNTQKWQDFMELVFVENEVFGKFKTSNEIKKAGELLGLQPIDLASLLKLTEFPEMYRIIPYIYAIEIYTMYENDPQLACKTMYEIMKDNSEKPEESLKMLESFGLKANQNSSKYHQDLILKLERMPFND